MEKLLLPGAILVASVILAVTFRTELWPLGDKYLMRDRWTGEVSLCRLWPSASGPRCVVP